MISLKKYLEMEVPAPPSEAPRDEVLTASVEAYRCSLQSMGGNANRTCAVFGGQLQSELNALVERLSGAVTPQSLTEIGNEARTQLDAWGDRGIAYLNTKAAEIKELLMVLARTAASVGERDQQYTEHFNDFTSRLRSISNLEDLTQVRSSLVQQANELKTYVEQMEQDSHKLVNRLQTQVSAYEDRLKKVEELAVRDPLTGISNRRNLEERTEVRIVRGQTFSVVMLDLNRLKVINDQHGHLAGDSLLQQFAQELRSSTRSSDEVGRWGGDEFMLVLDGDEANAKSQIERIKKWVFGQYTIRPGKGSGEVKVVVDAAIGLAQWQKGETLAEVVGRADAAMYQDKQLARAARSSG